MKLGRKAMFLGIGIFFTGFIIGGIGGGTLVGKYLQKNSVVPVTREGFKKAVYNIMKPNRSQKENLKSCIENAAEEVSDINIHYREQVISIIDTMFNCSKKYLDNDQKEHFKTEYENLIRKHNRLKTEERE